jgi:RNA polymerase-associated protein
MLKKPNPSETVLYSRPNCLYSHAVRFIASEKDLECDVVNTEFENLPEDLIAYNPTGTMPMLFDRGLIVYDMSVIMEYLDERFPFPSMLPLDPIEKAEKRTLIYRFTRAQNNWYDLVHTINNDNKKQATEAKQILTNNLMDLAPLFAYKPFFNSDSLGALDACIAPVLWRLDSIGIPLNKTHKAIIEYANRIFTLESFQTSLTDAEKELR